MIPTPQILEASRKLPESALRALHAQGGPGYIVFPDACEATVHSWTWEDLVQEGAFFLPSNDVSWMEAACEPDWDFRIHRLGACFFDKQSLMIHSAGEPAVSALKRWGVWSFGVLS